MKETLYERTIRDLPEKISDEDLTTGIKLIGKFLEENRYKYYMLMAPIEAEKGYLYNTIFKVENDGITGIQEFILNELGNIQKIDYQGPPRIDFYCDNKMYSMFGYDKGVIIV